MAEILGLGATHFPPLAGRDEDMAGILRRALADPALPISSTRTSASRIASRDAG
jgi:hypothetical protein